MSTHRQDFGPFSFEAPSTWLVRPMIVFEEPPQVDAPSAAGFVLTRDYRVRGEALLAYGWRRVFEIARDNPERRLVDRRETKISGQAAFRAVFEWTTDAETTRESIAWIDGGEDTVLVATCTAVSDDAFERFEMMLATLRFAVSTPVAAAAPPTTVRTPLPPPEETTGVYAAVPMPGARSIRF